MLYSVASYKKKRGKKRKAATAAGTGLVGIVDVVERWGAKWFV